MTLKIKMLILAGTLVVLTGMGLLIWGLNKNKSSVSLKNNSQVRLEEGKNLSEAEVSTLEAEPKQISGVVETIDGETLSLRQDASEEINYEIKKSEVSSVSVWVSNETFDPEKYKELMYAMPELGEDIKTADELTPEKAEEINKKRNEANQQMAADPALKAFSEEASDWSQIVKGSEIMVDVDSAGKKITILPAGFLDQMRGE